MIKVKDRVKIGRSAKGDPCPMEPKYRGKEGLVVAIADSMLTVEVEGVGVDGFFPEELTVIGTICATT